MLSLATGENRICVLHRLMLRGATNHCISLSAAVAVGLAAEHTDKNRKIGLCTTEAKRRAWELRLRAAANHCISFSAAVAVGLAAEHTDKNRKIGLCTTKAKRRA
jgi:hypothetical protein